MSDIQNLEGRITAALDRIRYSTERLTAVAVPEPAPAAEPATDTSAELDELRRQLEEERTANAQLEERIKALNEQHREGDAEKQAALAKNAATLSGLDADMQRLRASNAELRELNAQLRSSAAEGAAAPELINRATLAEVEALEAQRATDVAEIDAILGELKPLIEEA